MSESIISDENAIFDRDELIKKVIEKHKRLIGEYTAEFNELDKKITLLQKQTERSKKEKELILERIEILKEKRQQLYHQAQNVLGDIFDEVDEAMLDNKLMHTINDTLIKVRRAMDFNDEKQIVDDIMVKLVQMENNDAINSSVQHIKTRLNESIESSEELSNLIGKDTIQEELFYNADEQLKKLAPRHGWLDNRLKSHNDALKHWENVYLNKNELEPDT